MPPQWQTTSGLFRCDLTTRETSIRDGQCAGVVVTGQGSSSTRVLVSIARVVHGSMTSWWIEVTEFCRREGSDGSYGWPARGNRGGFKILDSSPTFASSNSSSVASGFRLPAPEAQGRDCENKAPAEQGSDCRNNAPALRRHSRKPVAVAETLRRDSSLKVGRWHIQILFLLFVFCTHLFGREAVALVVISFAVTLGSQQLSNETPAFRVGLILFYREHKEWTDCQWFFSITAVGGLMWWRIISRGHGGSDMDLYFTFLWEV